ncbi:MAG: hypothetical protein Q8R38_03810 [Candidatus Omnitrophota bacterium]|nr:hypothetical protein [Candidatus Omnitrophota bacterium]
MRNKKLIMAIVIAIALIGFVLVAKSMLSSGKGSRPVPATQVKRDLKKVPAAKKAISKGKGALTVKIFNFKNAEIPMRVKAFKVVDSKSSVYAASTVGGRTQEVLPGVYDIEVDTVPQKIYKNVKVNEGKETVENLGCVTGAMTVKTVNARKAAANYPLRILYGRTNEMVTAFMTNKALEIVPGVYDIEVGTTPRFYKKDIKVEAGKESIVDLGCLTGTLLIRTVDENNKEVRCSVKVARADTNETVSSSTSNKPIEIGKGKYNIDVLSSPKNSKKDVMVNPGEELIIEFTVMAPIVPQKGIVTTPKAAKAKR